MSDITNPETSNEPVEPTPETPVEETDDDTDAAPV